MKIHWIRDGLEDVRKLLAKVRYNVTMQVGAAAETVEVTSNPGTELQTANASVRTTLSGNKLLRLPTIQRQVSPLLGLQPAVNPMVTNDVLGDQVAGAASDQTNFLAVVSKSPILVRLTIRDGVASCSVAEENDMSSLLGDLRINRSGRCLYRGLAALHVEVSGRMDGAKGIITNLDETEESKC